MPLVKNAYGTLLVNGKKGLSFLESAELQKYCLLWGAVVDPWYLLILAVPPKTN